MRANLAELRQQLDAQTAERERVARMEQYLVYRVRYLPKQITAARTKLVHLEREAARLGIAV